MEKGKIKLKTKRLIIEPMADDEMEQLIAETKDSAIKAAFQKMYDDTMDNPKDWLWYVLWKISLKDTKKKIGEACFKGPAQDYSVEIGYGIDDTMQGKGYMTEAARALIDWALSQPDVYFVEAETTEDNVPSKRVLEKLKFKEDGKGEEGPRFVLEQALTEWMPIFMLFGISIGSGIGNLSDSVGIGMCMGMSVGLLVGVLMDNLEKKRRQKIREERMANRVEANQ